MTSELPPSSAVKALLLDIEGTTTPIDFVYQVLFPYARAGVKEFLTEHQTESDVQADLARLREEHAADLGQGLNPPPLATTSPQAERESLIAYFHWLMDHDRKSTPLKSLQGQIWKEGYRAGNLKSQVFADVPPAFERWRKQQKAIYIFSSGSVLAQRLLFAHTTAGDLTGFIQGYFDTNFGAKAEPQSYQKIAQALQCAPAEILFVSDVTAELAAAAAAGLLTSLCVRPGNKPQPATAPYPVIHTFAPLLP